MLPLGIRETDAVTIIDVGYPRDIVPDAALESLQHLRRLGVLLFEQCVHRLLLHLLPLLSLKLPSFGRLDSSLLLCHLPLRRPESEISFGSHHQIRSYLRPNSSISSSSSSLPSARALCLAVLKLGSRRDLSSLSQLST